MAESSWALFLREVSGGSQGRQIADRTGIPESTISRWLSGSAQPRPRQVLTVARAYGVSNLSAMVAAGLLTEDEVGVPIASPRAVQIRSFTMTELTEELHRRAIAGELD